MSALSRWIDRTAEFLAQHKGLPIVIGAGLIVLDFLLLLLHQLASGLPVLGALATLHCFLYLGLIIALLGGLIAEVL
ncbi:hypothetical protein [Thermoflexus sp.]|uniref:hypothetical protein n=1 Tax=Thermoflexus sp. TaxID=1969742 RepID=UPI0025D2F05F|nr:hypothetical protein [Thermoflexus sp.]MDW8179606.1 hypothetical protein [Anaerolineae bacterium]MCS6963746.1 hypothetical protein [Thermoflexus sp.]MCS7350157.1 hypothetical protein [Thermoflexus sp.]MCX7689522.1 hypothetical protein [Thermoflexus sp.]MDW8184576.1 hypothetical protein [Anaerolineae bacterium]